MQMRRQGSIGVPEIAYCRLRLWSFAVTMRTHPQAVRGRRRCHIEAAHLKTTWLVPKYSLLRRPGRGALHCPEISGHDDQMQVQPPVTTWMPVIYVQIRTLVSAGQFVCLFASPSSTTTMLEDAARRVPSMTRYSLPTTSSIPIVAQGTFSSRKTHTAPRP